MTRRSSTKSTNPTSPDPKLPNETEEETTPSTDTKTSPTSTPSSNKEEEEEGEETPEVWDLHTDLRSTSKKKKKCMTDGCKKNAVATWISNLQPDEPWHTCEGCQENDFGGWPDDHEALLSEKKKGEGGKEEEESVESEESGVEGVSKEEKEEVGSEERDTEAPSMSPDDNSTSSKKDLGSSVEKEDNKAASDNDGTANICSDEEDTSLLCSTENAPSTKKMIEHSEDMKNTTGSESEKNIVSQDDQESGDENANTTSSQSSSDKAVTQDVESNDEGNSPKDKGNDSSSKETDTEGGPNPASDDSKEVNANVKVGEIEFEPFLTSEDEAVVKEQDDQSGKEDEDDRKSESDSSDSVNSSEDKDTTEKKQGTPEKADENDVKGSEQGSAEKDQGQSGEEDGEEEEPEVWDLKMVLSGADIIKKKPVMCSTDNCPLVACCVWVSNLNPSDPWYSCLDCQEMDFGGWPSELHELPIKTMLQTHKDAIINKCTRLDAPTMPDLPEPKASPAKSAITTMDASSSSGAVTPPPGKDGVGKLSTTTAQAKTSKQKKMVTPSPVPPPRPAQPSAAALAMHRKWQAEAEKLGGPEARIVVSKPDAKKIIFDMLHESFRPMNITEIYKKLKAVVPSPVLKSCLDDMLDQVLLDNPFDCDSDDEDEGKKKKSKTSSTSNDPFAGSLMLKQGRNSNTTLYYIDHSKLHNNGNGLLPDERNELAGNYEQSKAEEEALSTNLKSITATTDRLNSEPTNEEAVSKLEVQEKEMTELREELESARELVVNEKRKRQIQKKNILMTTHWRKRRRLCMDFLIMMEESTEGTVSVKKCLKGDGQIDIDSDEAVVEGAVEWGKKKRARGKMGASGRPFKKSFKGKTAQGKTMSGNSTSDMQATEEFVGVKLDSRGNVIRVHLDDDTD